MPKIVKAGGYNTSVQLVLVWWKILGIDVRISCERAGSPVGTCVYGYILTAQGEVSRQMTWIQLAFLQWSRPSMKSLISAASLQIHGFALFCPPPPHAKIRSLSNPLSKKGYWRLSRSFPPILSSNLFSFSSFPEFSVYVQTRSQWIPGNHSPTTWSGFSLLRRSEVPSLGS